MNPVESIYYSPEIINCPDCGGKLTYCHPVWRKTISTLKGEYRVINLGYRCENNACENNTVYRSSVAEQLSMKHITYGLDVIVHIGHLRFKEHKTRLEITSILTEKQVKISERQVQKLYERYALLLRSAIKDNMKRTLEKVVEQNSVLILFIDGVQPEKGNETLHVIREVLSGSILAAYNLKSSASQELISIIQPIIDWGYPIQGFISDGQQSIRLAIEKIAPDIPYQYYQFHYFKDIAKPLVGKDRKLKTNIKKKLRGIREIERRIEESSSESLEEEIASDYVAAIRSVFWKMENHRLNCQVHESTNEQTQSRDRLKNAWIKKGDSFT